MAQPIIKWVGGKRGITDKLLDAMPEQYNDYWEPFFGGGAMFLALSPSPEHKAHISDINEDLIATYKAVRRAPRKLMAMLDDLAKSHSEEFYYQMRASEPTDIMERAARFIFLNKTCFNGLTRYNSKGKFNSPWGHKENPVTLYNEENILAFVNAIRGAEISCQSYDRAKPKTGDFVYLDPPYDLTYNSYHENGFGEEGQRKLAEWCKELDEAGTLWMLSNSDTQLINNLYKEFNISYIRAPRSVSCKGDGRKAVQEVLITNYGTNPRSKS